MCVWIIPSLKIYLQSTALQANMFSVKICENDAEEKLFLILVAAGMNVWVTEDMVVGIGWC